MYSESCHAVVPLAGQSDLPEQLALANAARAQHGDLKKGDSEFCLLVLTRDAIAAFVEPPPGLAAEDWLESLYDEDAPAILAGLKGLMGHCGDAAQVAALEDDLERRIDARGVALLGDKYLPFSARFVKMPGRGASAPR